MGAATVAALRMVIALALAGSLLVQGLLVAALVGDPGRTGLATRLTLVVMVVLGVLALQAVAVCVWRLLGMARQGTVFTLSAFRYVDVVIASISVVAVLLLGIAVLAAVVNRTSPGDEVAPGLVGLVCGAALVAAGVALVVLVLRTLLAQAVDLDIRTRALQSELDEVI